MITAHHLTKTFMTRIPKEGRFAAFRSLFHSEYKENRAVDDVSFQIGEGEIVGYIGPNWAGKSTTIKMLSGILVPTGGEVVINGLTPHKQRKQHALQIGVVFGQKTALWWDVPVIESLKLLKDMYQVPEDRYQQNLGLFQDILGLKEFIDKPVRQLSLGQRMRADLAAALLHDPKLLFLDEPTIGLDVVTKENLQQFIKEINHLNQVTVLVTTHDMHDLEKLCSRVMIINEGHLVYDGSLENIRHQYGRERILVAEFEQDVPEIELPRARLVHRGKRKQGYAFDRFETTAADILAALSATGYPIIDISIDEPDIEDIIRHIYRRGYHGEVSVS